MFSSRKSHPPRIAYVTSEMAPFAKVGGLADVAASLPGALRELGVDVRIFLPFYSMIERTEHKLVPCDLPPHSTVRLGSKLYPFNLYQTKINDVPVYLVQNEHFFDRKGIYTDPVTGDGYTDNPERFIFFQKALLFLFRNFKWIPDIVHCNDHPTGLLPFYMKRDRVAATVFTIHNLAYQGLTGSSILPLAEIPRDQFYPMSPFEFYGKVNMLKIALEFADSITTVSPSYALEIQSSSEFGAGLEGVLKKRSDDLTGILNGVDYSIWNPETDSSIKANYSVDDLDGKAKNKRALQKRLNLIQKRKRVPVLAMIGRLVDQKGLDILIPSLKQLLLSDIQVVVLGTGHQHYQDQLLRLARTYPRKCSVELRYDNELAHLIEAGSDIFLMPSLYEPCGLNQMYSLRYGTIPVVRNTGGLADTVTDYSKHRRSGTGFSFDNYSVIELLKTLRYALQIYDDKNKWNKIVTRAMKTDFSWNVSAQKYLDLYKKNFKIKSNKDFPHV